MFVLNYISCRFWKRFWFYISENSLFIRSWLRYIRYINSVGKSTFMIYNRISVKYLFTHKCSLGIYSQILNLHSYINDYFSWKKAKAWSSQEIRIQLSSLSRTKSGEQVWFRQEWHSAVFSGGAGSARAPPEFGGSQKGQSLSLAITMNTPGFEKLTTALFEGVFL